MQVNEIGKGRKGTEAKSLQNMHIGSALGSLEALCSADAEGVCVCTFFLQGMAVEDINASRIRLGCSSLSSSRTSSLSSYKHRQDMEGETVLSGTSIHG